MLLSAKDARRESEKQLAVKKELQFIELLVNQKIKEGKTSVSMPGKEIMKAVEAELKKFGYTVEYHLVESEICTLIKW